MYYQIGDRNFLLRTVRTYEVRTVLNSNTLQAMIRLSSFSLRKFKFSVVTNKLCAQPVSRQGDSK